MSSGDDAALSSWETDRQRLDHRVLNNQFLLVLRDAIRLIEDGQLTDDLEGRLLREDLPRWPELLEEITDLVARFGREMSPVCLFRREPLHNMAADDREWLAELVETLWRSRCRVDTLVDSTGLDLGLCDASFQRLVDAWEEDRDSMRLKRLSLFADACEILSWGLSRFPRRVGSLR